MVLKNIKIEEEVWWELNKLKVENKLKKLSDVVKLLLERK